MKVFIHYEDHDNPCCHKSLKITLPKSWKTGPTSNLLQQFVESYNGNETLGGQNPLDVDDLHLGIRQQSNENSTGSSHEMIELASDATVLDVISDRADIYVLHGSSRTIEQIQIEKQIEQEKLQQENANLVKCVHFGCQNKFHPNGPYPNCQYHKSPPVFHETAKFWSCCPNKKAYDWDDFQNIPGCQTGTCTHIKEESAVEQKQFLGGTDLREQLAGDGPKLKSIDDFNRAQAAGGSEAAPVLDRLQKVLLELGMENELYQQVLDGMKSKVDTGTLNDEAELLEAIKVEMGEKLITAFKSIAAEQLRIK